jgi:hypothetical protein
MEPVEKGTSVGENIGKNSAKFKKMGKNGQKNRQSGGKEPEKLHFMWKRIIMAENP